MFKFSMLRILSYVEAGHPNLHPPATLRPTARTRHAAHCWRSARRAAACVRAHSISHPPHVPGATALTPGRYDHSFIHP